MLLNLLKLKNKKYDLVSDYICIFCNKKYKYRYNFNHCYRKNEYIFNINLNYNYYKYKCKIDNEKICFI